MRTGEHFRTTAAGYHTATHAASTHQVLRECRGGVRPGQEISCTEAERSAASEGHDEGEYSLTLDRLYTEAREMARREGQALLIIVVGCRLTTRNAFARTIYQQNEQIREGGRPGNDKAGGKRSYVEEDRRAKM